MIKKPILIICGEPNSVFSELIIKASKKYKSKKPILLIGSYNLISLQIKKLKLKHNLHLINYEKKLIPQLKKSQINILNVDYKFKKPFDKISSKSNNYISNSFDKAFKVIKSNKIKCLINGPISKKYFLNKKYPGVTEYLANKFNIKNNFAMLIFNKSLSVSPITTHLPVYKIAKKINKNSIILKIKLVSDFFEKYLSKKPSIAVCGLNPHCENFLSISEEKEIIKPAINFLKMKKLKVFGPYPSDTIFLKQNIKNIDVIIGMYHDQVLTPIKALHGFNAINITLGLPFIRVSPDHGPNYNMIGKNKSNPQSLIEAIKFLDKIK